MDESSSRCSSSLLTENNLSRGVQFSYTILMRQFYIITISKQFVKSFEFCQSSKKLFLNVFLFSTVIKSVNTFEFVHTSFKSLAVFFISFFSLRFFRRTILLKILSNRNVV
jgi:hypothetical protein